MKRIAFAAIALLLAQGTASAAILYSAPARAGFSDSYLECLVQNVSSSPRTVSIELLDFSGAVVATSYPKSIGVHETAFLVGNSHPTAASCRVIVAGSAKNVRAQANYYDPDTYRFTISLPVE
jgi:hypothetical protein